MKTRNFVIKSILIFALLIAVASCASTPTRSSTGELIDDSVITTKVKSLLAADSLLMSFEISVETFKGTVQLSGFVSSKDAVEKAERIAKSVQGVKTVKNDLIIK